VACSDQGSVLRITSGVTSGAFLLLGPEEAFRLVSCLASLQVSIRQRGQGAVSPVPARHPAGRDPAPHALLASQEALAQPRCSAQAQCQSTVVGGVPDREPDRSLPTIAWPWRPPVLTRLVVKNAYQLPSSGLGGPGSRSPAADGGPSTRPATTGQADLAGLPAEIGLAVFGQRGAEDRVLHPDPSVRSRRCCHGR
jgi:hypothetical protein